MEHPLPDNPPESTYNVTRDEDGVLRVGFGAPSHNGQIVKDVYARLEQMQRVGELSAAVCSRLMSASMIVGHGPCSKRSRYQVCDYVIAISPAQTRSMRLGGWLRDDLDWWFVVGEGLGCRIVKNG